MVIDLKSDFYIKQVINMSKRLIKEKGLENRVLVTIEEDTLAPHGCSIVLVDASTHQKLKVNADRLYAYYHTRPISEYLSDLP